MYKLLYSGDFIVPPSFSFVRFLTKFLQLWVYPGWTDLHNILSQRGRVIICRFLLFPDRVGEPDYRQQKWYQKTPKRNIACNREPIEVVDGHWRHLNQYGQSDYWRQKNLIEGFYHY